MRVAALALLATVCGGGASAMDVPAAKAGIDRTLDADYPRLDALYKDLHAHPELAFEETRTAGVLAKQMRADGFEVAEHVGKTGLVAIYRNGPGPVVMVRTELDALPMEEKTGVPYASRAQGQYRGKPTFIAHSCGHDIHMAAWIGTAEALVAMKDRWSGTLMFIAQPAEEAVGGAKVMLADGLFTRFPKPTYGFALHGGPAAAGSMGWKSGVMNTNADSIEIDFKGRGGHGSMPHLSIDPVMIAARFVVDVQGVVSREKDPLDAGVITIGAINGGSAGNIIPDDVRVMGTIRNYDQKTRAKLIAGVKRVALAEAMMAGAPEPTINIGEDQADAVINDQGLVDRTAPVWKAAFGDRAQAASRPGAASEDYSAFIEAGVPSLYFGIGVYDPKRVAAANDGGPPLPNNHSPYYEPTPEPTIRTGVEAMSLAVMNVMPKG